MNRRQDKTKMVQDEWNEKYNKVCLRMVVFVVARRESYAYDYDEEGK